MKTTTDLTTSGLRSLIANIRLATEPEKADIAAGYEGLFEGYAPRVTYTFDGKEFVIRIREPLDFEEAIVWATLQTRDEYKAMHDRNNRAWKDKTGKSGMPVLEAEPCSAMPRNIAKIIYRGLDNPIRYEVDKPIYSYYLAVAATYGKPCPTLTDEFMAWAKWHIFVVGENG